MIRWKETSQAIDGDTACYYLIYRFEKKQAINPEDPRHIIAILRKPATEFTDTSVLSRWRYVYFISAVDRLHTESSLSTPVKVKAKRKK